MTERTRPVSAPTPQTPSTATDASTARFELPAAGFALVELFERVPDATVELEPAVASPDDHALLMIEADAHRAVDAALRSSPSVAAVERFGREEHRSRYRVTWEGHARRVLRGLVAEDVTLTRLHGASGRWKLRVLAPDRAAIARAYEVLEDLGCDPNCRSITTFGGGWVNPAGVTEKQHQALARAFELGYYDIPRDITIEELGADLGISHQALSERFRRAYSQLVKETFIVGDISHR
jgi:predicted DNA binding protein